MGKDNCAGCLRAEVCATGLAVAVRLFFRMPPLGDSRTVRTSFASAVRVTRLDLERAWELQVQSIQLGGIEMLTVPIAAGDLRGQPLELPRVECGTPIEIKVRRIAQSIRWSAQ